MGGGGIGGDGMGGLDNVGAGGYGASSAGNGMGGDSLDPASGKACSCRTPGSESDTEGAIVGALAGFAAMAIARLRRRLRP